MLAKIFAKLFMRKNDVIDYVVVDSGVFCKKRDGTVVEGFHWSDVDQIEVYKVDLMIYDEVALLFKTENAKHEILEGHSAFQELISELHHYFDVRESWYLDAIEKPFETNWKTLYKKSS
ncbi:hypothetical protein [Gimesia aquarii]|uniref:Uncharacterized protein n=1 Tax=Gimesia aquarii TaxID=2527964 RepID=A0A517X0P6_9PLAN|nr:hypothetical protein [Gimesia aquarii]QDU11064.1 hypothetical protein V202x_44800 [Gimesia aquarii]